MDNTFIQEKLLAWLTFNPGLALTGFRTTRPRKLGLTHTDKRKMVQLYYFVSGCVISMLIFIFINQSR